MSLEMRIGCCHSCMGSGVHWETQKLCKACLGTGSSLTSEFYDKFEPYHVEYAEAKKEGLTLSEYAYAVLSNRIGKNRDGKKYPNVCPYCKAKVQNIGINGVQYVCGFFKCSGDPIHRPHARTDACKLIATYRSDYEMVRRFYRDNGGYYTDVLNNTKFAEIHNIPDEIDGE